MLGRWARVGGGAGRDCTELGVELGEPFVLALDQRSSGFHEAAGQHPIYPTIRSLTGNNLGSEPSARAPSGAPEREAQCIPKQLAAFTGAGGTQIGRANANALAAEGNAGEDYGEGGDLGGGVEALQQFGGGLGWRRTSRAAN